MLGANTTPIIRATFHWRDGYSPMVMLYRMPLKPVIRPFTMKCIEVAKPIRAPPMQASPISYGFQDMSKLKVFKFIL